MTEDEAKNRLPPYEGDDMTSFALGSSFEFPTQYGRILSATNVRDFAIVVTEFAIWRVRPCRVAGFCVEIVLTT